MVKNLKNAKQLGKQPATFTEDSHYKSIMSELSIS